VSEVLEVTEVTNPPPLGTPTLILAEAPPILEKIPTKSEVGKRKMAVDIHNTTSRILKGTVGEVLFKESDILRFCQSVFNGLKPYFFQDALSFDEALWKLKEEHKQALKPIPSSSKFLTIKDTACGNNFISSSMPVPTLDIMDFFNEGVNVYTRMFSVFGKLMSDLIIWPEDMLFCMETGRMAVKKNETYGSAEFSVILLNPIHFRGQPWASRVGTTVDIRSVLEAPDMHVDHMPLDLVSSLIVGERLGMEVRASGSAMQKVENVTWFSEKTWYKGNRDLEGYPIAYSLKILRQIISINEIPKLQKMRSECKSLTDFYIQNGWLHEGSFNVGAPGQTWELGEFGTGSDKIDVILRKSLSQLKEMAAGVKARPIVLTKEDEDLIAYPLKPASYPLSFSIGDAFEVMARLPEQLIPLDVHGQVALARGLFHRIGSVFPEDPWRKAMSMPDTVLTKEIESIIAEGVVLK